MTPDVLPDVFIPAGPYCYQLLEVVERPGELPLLKTRTCGHFEKSNATSRCNLLKVKDDILLDDSCKICGINDSDHD